MTEARTARYEQAYQTWRGKRTIDGFRPLAEMTTFLGECTCGSLIVEKGDGTAWDWTPIAELQGAIRTRHSCIGKAIVETTAELERRDAERARAAAVPVTVPATVSTPVARPVDQPSDGEPRRARGTIAP